MEGLLQTIGGNEKRVRDYAVRDVRGGNEGEESKEHGKKLGLLFKMVVVVKKGGKFFLLRSAFHLQKLT